MENVIDMADISVQKIELTVFDLQKDGFNQFSNIGVAKFSILTSFPWVIIW